MGFVKHNDWTGAHYGQLLHCSDGSTRPSIEYAMKCARRSAKSPYSDVTVMHDWDDAECPRLDPSASVIVIPPSNLTEWWYPRPLTVHPMTETGKFSLPLDALQDIEEADSEIFEKVLT